jgi:hypothetical protein
LNLFLNNIKKELKEDLNDNISEYDKIIKLIFIKEEYDSKFDISKSFQFIKLLNHKSIYYILSDLIQNMDSEFYEYNVNDIIFIIFLLQGLRNKKFLKLVDEEKKEEKEEKSIIYQLINQIDKILDYIDKNKNMKANMTYAMKTKTNQKIPNEIIKYIQGMIAKDETVIINKLKDKLKKLKDIISNDKRIFKSKSNSLSSKIFSKSHGLSYNDIKKNLSSQKGT